MQAVKKRKRESSAVIDMSRRSLLLVMVSLHVSAEEEYLTEERVRPRSFSEAFGPVVFYLTGTIVGWVADEGRRDLWELFKRNRRSR